MNFLRLIRKRMDGVPHADKGAAEGQLRSCRPSRALFAKNAGPAPVDAEKAVRPSCAKLMDAAAESISPYRSDVPIIVRILAYPRLDALLKKRGE